MRVTQDMLQKMRDEGKKIAVLTCYDASFAALLEKAGVDILLVGDSLAHRRSARRIRSGMPLS